MVETVSFKRLILRVVLRRVSPMVIRLVSVSDQIKLQEFHQIFCAMLGWNGDLGYIVRVHGQEFNSFRRKTRSKALHELELHRQEKFLYICDILHMWEWDVRVLDIQQGTEHNLVPICLGGRGATPPELCGGPTGYRLIAEAATRWRCDVRSPSVGSRHSDVGQGLPGPTGTDLGSPPDSAGRRFPEHRSKIEGIRTGATGLV